MLKVYSSYKLIKLFLTGFLVLSILCCAFHFALHEDILVVNHPEDIVNERMAAVNAAVESVINESRDKYTKIGFNQANEINHQELLEVVDRYEAAIQDYQSRILELEGFFSSDYENYAYYFYQMTEDQFMEFCAVVQAEGLSYRNQVAITQTAINLALYWGGTPYYWMCQSGAYTTPTTAPLLNSTIQNVTAVFLDGARVTSRPIKFFYSYALMPDGSAFHNKQVFVMSIDDHNFYE